MYKILVVDDEIVSTVVLGEVLREAGYLVETALNGEDGIAIGRKFQPELIISDWKLKDKIDGCELARTLQAENAALKVILFSGSSSVELAQEAKDIKVYSILEKPCEIEEMMEKVRQALASA
jgi:DNA-binding NtrC family response regulator